MPANTWLELDRDAVTHNARQLAALVAPARIMAVIKANAYGAGAVPIAQALEDAGVDAFAVASVPEAIELRAAGVRGTILVLTYVGRDDADAVLEHDVRPAVFTTDTAEMLATAAERRGQRARVWIKVDTGLGRLGVRFPDAPEFVRQIAKHPALVVDGLFSTLAENPERNPVQVDRLLAVHAALPELTGVVLSIASSQGILSMPRHGLASRLGGAAARPATRALEYVRPGLTLLGVVPHPERLDAALVRQADLRPVVTWKARVAYVKVVPPGEQVGYGPRAALDRELRVATLAVGWADGYAQTLQGVGHVVLRGRRVPILAMSANSTMVDLTGAGDVRVGDEAVLLGRQGEASIATDEIAHVIGSFYRVLAFIPRGVPRVWV
ncbi:MAG: alanine racemase [Candidatus Rokubacteria bacterium]|nr:alanine racemase [Candidatus Rokubacteria bacterium]